MILLDSTVLVDVLRHERGVMGRLARRGASSPACRRSRSARAPRSGLPGSWRTWTAPVGPGTVDGMIASIAMEHGAALSTDDRACVDVPGLQASVHEPTGSVPVQTRKRYDAQASGALHRNRMLRSR